MNLFFTVWGEWAFGFDQKWRRWLLFVLDFVNKRIVFYELTNTSRHVFKEIDKKMNAVFS